MPRNKSISDEAILAACRASFLAWGIGVATKDLAKHAGVSEGVLFQRFKSKEVLFFLAMRLPPPNIVAPDEAEAIEHIGNSQLVKDAVTVKVKQQIVDVAFQVLVYLREQMPSLFLILSHPAYLTQTHPAEVLMDARSIREALKNPVERYAHLLLAAGEKRLSPNKEAKQASIDTDMICELVVAALITRAMHEGMGMEAATGERDWLHRMVNTLLAPSVD